MFFSYSSEQAKLEAIYKDAAESPVFFKKFRLLKFFIYFEFKVYTVSIEQIPIFKIKKIMGVGGTVLVSLAICLLIGLIIELKERHLN